MGGSSSDIWVVGMSSLSQGGFFLCRLLVLSRRGSAMFSVPPQACQLHTQETKPWVSVAADKTRGKKFTLGPLNTVVRMVGAAALFHKRVLRPLAWFEHGAFTCLCSLDTIVYRGNHRESVICTPIHHFPLAQSTGPCKKRNKYLCCAVRKFAVLNVIP